MNELLICSEDMHVKMEELSWCSRKFNHEGFIFFKTSTVGNLLMLQIDALVLLRVMKLTL